MKCVCSFQELLLLRHHHEAESLFAVQKMDWEWKMKEVSDMNNVPVIDDLHVPMVQVNDDFDLLPSQQQQQQHRLPHHLSVQLLILTPKASFICAGLTYDTWEPMEGLICCAQLPPSCTSSLQLFSILWGIRNAAEPLFTIKKLQRKTLIVLCLIQLDWSRLVWLT